MLLNLDAGELPEESENLWALFDVLHVACGGHAGDEHSMARVVGFCARDGIRVGAHPSYPDREGFGRRSIALPVAELEHAVTLQCTALAAVARGHGVAVESVKPHGALYHDAACSRAIADAVIRGATAALGDRLAIVGPPTGALRDAARAAGLRYAREGFADRRTREDGTLVPRGEPGALVALPEEAARRALAIAGDVDTICVHADTPDALAIARAVRQALRDGAA